MKIVLLFPPNWTPSMPHLALPTLTAYLRDKGIEVIQRDLNATTFDEILTQTFIVNSVERLRADYGADARRHPTDRQGLPKREHVLWALREGERIAREVEDAKRILKSERFFDGETSLPAFETIIQALEIASLPFFPASLTLQTYISASPTDSSAALLQAVRDENHNIFLDLFRNGILKEIEREKPDIVGISIPSMPQMLAGMTLGYLVKHSGLDCHVTVGGPHISMLRDELAKAPAIFSLFDSAVVFDGEVPLYNLAQALAGDGDLSNVPNLVYRDGDTIRVTDRKTPEKIGDLPIPDFDGLPLDKYLAPYLALPLLTARGCYFGKCAFCNVGYGEAESFSQLRAEKLVEQMVFLNRKYGTRHIFFSDEAITPKNLRAFPPMLEAMGTPFHWGGCARFEAVISRELLETMQHGGCRMILYGLESASEAIMDRMIKGTKVEDMSRILVESADAGIWNHTFFFFGFPGETLADAQKTVNFLFEHKPYIHSAAMGTFLMERYSPAHRFPQNFGVSKIVDDPAKDLAIYFDYEVADGMDSEFAERVADRFMDTLPTKSYPQFYANDVYRFLYASYLSEQNKPMIPWLIPEQHQV